MNIASKSLVWFFSISVAIASWRFMIGDVAETMDIVAHNLATRQIPLFAHIIFAPIALFLMPFQFWNRLRTKRPRIHRWIGRTYVAAIVISGMGGLIIAPFATTGPLAATGFFILAILWIGTTLMAVNHARRRRIAAHKIWMIRSASLTFAAVTLRLWLPFFFMATSIEFSTFYPWVAWLAWVPNLIFAELYIRRRRI